MDNPQNGDDRVAHVGTAPFRSAGTPDSRAG
jgi:hypothetical protein